MINKNMVIAIGILAISILGFFLFFEITGNTITGSVVNEDEATNEYPLASDINDQKNKQEGLNDTQNISR
jgi:hypothetical protein